ncbi:hypothetical protein YZ82_05680 [Campylobacter hyointestinalis]|uniref:Uncharacterized protein n=1 Tax=Campylobacter hyointestinalis TaxID=198 RepID=A0A562XBS9_CAMHY|nr:hypothetical protein [Campylobacter hyointestinalis]TWO19590.1 hypothetical protein YZ82_05680 [Campylobacter hyointestinalis]
MKVAQAYSIMALIFANNFRVAISDENLKKLNINWLIKTENEENKKGHTFLANALQTCDSVSIANDLDGFKGACDLKFFKHINEEKIESFYRSINFNKPFEDLKASHISNMLALLCVIFKSDVNDKTHALLGLYLSEYLLPSLMLFGKFIRYNAKTDYYRALGEFLIDYCKIIKKSLGLKVALE